jgi:integrase
MREAKPQKYYDPNKPHLKFYVRYREAGKPRRKFFETREAAKSFAGFKNAERTQNGVIHAEFPEKLRNMAQEATERLQPFGKTIRDATDHYVRYLKATEKSCSVEQLVKELLKAKEADGVGERYLRDLRNRLGTFVEEFDGRMVATITSTDINEWLRSLTVAGRTRNHYRANLILAFNFAVEKGYVTDNPTSGKKLARAKMIGKPPGILTVDQAARLLESATPELLPYIAIGLFAGLRRAELERLDWKEIDFESSLIEVTAAKAKTAMRRFVKIEPNLRAWLLPLRQLKGQVAPAYNFRQLFEGARYAAGIDGWPENALRHSFASYHMAHFKNAASTALELGHHDSRMTFAHYRELVRPKDAARFWSIKPAGRTRKIVHMGVAR